MENIRATSKIENHFDIFLARILDFHEKDNYVISSDSIDTVACTIHNGFVQSRIN